MSATGLPVFDSTRAHLSFLQGSVSFGGHHNDMRPERRFKRPGQFWSQQGDQALLCLETFWRNDRWHLLFPHTSLLKPARN